MVVPHWISKENTARLKRVCTINSNYQCCGTVTICYGSGSGSGSGSDFWKVMVPVPVPFPTFEKLWFRFRFRYLLLKKLRFRFRFRFQLHIKTIKSKFLKKNLEFFYFLLSKLFYKEKVHEFQQIYAKMWMKKCLMKEIKYIILCLVPVPEP